MLKRMELNKTISNKGYSLLVKSYSPKLYVVTLIRDMEFIADRVYVSKRLTHTHGLLKALKQTSVMQKKEGKLKQAEYTYDICVRICSMIS
jgi:hypothetical protein